MKNLFLFLSFSCIFNFSFINAAEIHGTVASSIGKLKNAVVYIEKIEGKSFLPPKEQAVLNQIGLTFIPHVLPVMIGTMVSFPNNDTVMHNVFSPGYIKNFNLGTYPQGTSKEMRFDQAGIVLLLCNIHHEMSAFIVVVETPYFAVTDKNGHYDIRNLPPGRYKLAVWHEQMTAQVKEIEAPDQDIVTINFLMQK